MEIEMTASNGKTYTFKDFGKNGQYIQIRYVNPEGEELVYMIRITPKMRLVMN